jgi:hypothetical protein
MSVSHAELHSWFASTFDEPMPAGAAALLDGVTLVRPARAHSIDGATDIPFWTTDVATALTPSALMTPDFPDLGRDWVVIGHWGHGIASHAFYWVSVRGAHRHFFRLAFGGAYGDRAHDAREVARFLEGYAAFWQRHGEALSASELVCSMGQCRAQLEVTTPRGATTVRDAGPPRAPGSADPDPSAWWPWLDGQLARAREGQSQSSTDR